MTMLAGALRYHNGRPVCLTLLLAQRGYLVPRCSSTASISALLFCDVSQIIEHHSTMASATAGNHWCCLHRSTAHFGRASVESGAVHGVWQEMWNLSCLVHNFRPDVT
jgi:hypothetical protein